MPGTIRHGSTGSRASNWRVAAVVCALSLLAASATQVYADTCSDLREQLTAARNLSGSATSEIRRYTDAARRQAEEIEKTVAIQEAQGCFRNPDASCQQLARMIRQMKSNLSALESRRDRLTSRQKAGRVRAIEARLKANRCDARQPILRNGGSRPTIARAPQDPPDASATGRVIIRDGTGPARILGVAPDSTGVFENPDAITVPRLSGTFRTLCVRKCDGYYFPVSFSTTTSFFERDAAACSAMCPAAETELYFHRVPGEESEAMISLHGEPYTALPTAFLYRERRTGTADPSCTCGKPATHAQAQADLSDEDRPETRQAVPLPTDKPADALADPESRMNAASGLTGQRIRELTGAVTVGDVRSAENRGNVRVVGPEFLPDPEEAIDLRSRDRTAVR